MKKLGVFAVFFVCAFCFSCSENLVSPPTSSGGLSNPAAYSDAVLPPLTVQASHGGYRSVELSWSAVKNAVKYIVYSADTPFDSFEQIYITAGNETSYFAEEESGSTKYYCVSAVNYYGTVSKKSKVVCGTSLANPVITEIASSSEGSSVTVSWWMDNCDGESYEDSLEYLISVYNSDKIKLSDFDTSVTDGSARSVQIRGLSANTDYFFQVEAFISGREQNHTFSDLTSAATAHRIIPDAPLDFTVSQGLSAKEVRLSWALPSAVEYYDSSTNAYSTNPIYFVVNRKLSGQDDSEYLPLAKIGSGSASCLTMKFDCSSTATSDQGLLLSVYEEGSCPENFSAYRSGSTLTFVDDTCERGKVYTYMVQSYTDNTNKTFTGDSSRSQEVNGWTIGAASFNVNSVIEYSDDGSLISRVDAEFNFSFNPYTIQYTYVITCIKTSLDLSGVDEEKVEYCAGSVSQIKSYVHSFEDPASEAAYYNYKLYILPYQAEKVTSLPAAEDAIEVLEALQKVTVTDSADAIPQIKNFSVADGYSNKFILSWDEISGATYTVTYVPVENNIEETSVTVLLQNDDSSLDGYYTVKDSKVFYECPAVSGDVRKFALTVNTGLSTSESLEELYYTLGSVNLVAADADYDKITVTWPAVQMADGDYEVSAVYKGTGEELAVEGVCSTTCDEAAQTYTCVLNKPAGYDNPAISGKAVQLTVTAKNSRTGDTTNSCVEVHTLGPALINAAANTLPNSSNSLTLRWSGVDGAEKYLVYRIMYSDSSASEIEACDIYIVDAQSLEVKEFNGQSTQDRVSLKYGSGFYILTDKQVDAEESYGYQTHQEKIQWGLPFAYVVLPLKAGGSQNDFAFEEKSLSMADSSVVNYGSLSAVTTATYGYGLNVKASKATSATVVTVEWDKPYFKNLTPTLYRRQLYKSGAEWEKVATLGQGLSSYDLPIAKKDIPYAFEYAVQYEAASSCEFVSSFTKELSEKLEDSLESPRYTYPAGVKAEPLNKGYVLALADFEACYGGDGTTFGHTSFYQENLSWSAWDYNVRALGPDSFSVDLMNYNLSSDWNTISNVEISSDGEEKINTVNTWTDTGVSAGNHSIFVKPLSLSSRSDGMGTTDGLLKVLRDAKHYYSVNLTANHSAATITSRQGHDNSIYACRQVSNEELAKMALFVFAYGFYLNDGGDASYSNIADQFKYGGEGTQYGESGSAGFTARSRGTTDFGIGKFKFYYTFLNYGPSLYAPAGIYVTSPVAVTCDKHLAGIKGDADSYLYKFKDSHDIKISNCDPKVALDYSAVINFTCSDNNTLKVTISRASSGAVTLVDTSDNATRKRWFPMQIHSDETYELKSTTYGWWPSN